MELEGTCGYGIDGKIDDKPAGPHLLKKKKKEEESVDEERDYKAEYKKYGSSKKAKKYRAELNKYNRKKGTYGNGDGKDASHKGGKIVGFEAESKNRGGAEKSRLKKESVNEAKSFKPEKRRKLKSGEVEVMKGRGSKQKWFYLTDKNDVHKLIRLGRNYGFPTGITNNNSRIDKSFIKRLSINESVSEKVIKVSKKDDVPGNPMKMKGEEKIKKLAWSGSVGMKKPGSYEIKGNKLNVNNIRPRDKGFFVRHFTMGTGFRKANLYYDGVHWQGKKKF